MKIKNVNVFLKIFLIVFCALFIFTGISTAIISSDILHIKTCCDDDCRICQMIYSATQFSKNISYITKYIVLFYTMMPLICMIRTKINERLKETLVSLNVVLNE